MEKQWKRSSKHARTVKYVQVCEVTVRKVQRDPLFVSVFATLFVFECKRK